MDKPIEGEPAFSSDRFGMSGMSLRQYYIGQALMGFCANPRFANAAAEDVALIAVTQADYVMQFLYSQTEKKEPTK